MRTEELLRDYQEQVKPFYDRFFADWKKQAKKTNKLSWEMIDRFARLYPKGKQHRGALVVLGYQLAGGRNRQDILQASLLVELFHTAILIADDVFDEDERRRGGLTVHRQWEKHFKIRDLALKQAYGRNMALTTTIIGLYLAPLALTKTDFSPQLKEKVFNYFFSRMTYLGWGEALDISAPFQKLVEKKNSARMIHDLKTVDYSAVVPLHLGALLAGKEEGKWLKNFDRYGVCLGRIFQIQDDVIGSFGDPQKTGKADDSDLKGARWTILIEILWQKANTQDRKLLKQLFEKNKRTGKEIAKIKSLMRKYQVTAEARKKAEKHFQQAVKTIPRISRNKEDEETLINLLKFMLERTR